jgi:peptidylprolyl isomerase
MKTVLLAALVLLAGAPAYAKSKPQPAPTTRDLGLPPAALLGAPPPAAVAPPKDSDWRTPDPENVLVIDTNKGRIFVELSPATAPLGAARVRQLARQGFYDGRAFFRVIDDFMDQTGDPKDNGTGASTLPNLPPEFFLRRSSDMPFNAVITTEGHEAGFIGAVPVVSQPINLAAMTSDGKVAAYGTFCPGVAGLARSDAADSANSQFFLMRGTNNALDDKYAVWGRVIAGMDVVRSIKTGEPPPPPADVMKTVRVLADIPAADRPVVKVIDTGGAWFKAMVERVKADKISPLSLCDLELPSQVK